MALFGKERDISLFRNINIELLHKIIDTELLLYKINLQNTQVNIYEETTSYIYNSPILIHALISIDEQQWENQDYNADITQSANISFLRDDLIEKDLIVEVGDIIEYMDRFFEIDGIIENQFFTGKNPDNYIGGEEYGYNISINCSVHQTNQSKLNIIETRFSE